MKHVYAVWFIGMMCGFDLTVLALYLDGRVDMTWALFPAWMYAILFCLKFPYPFIWRKT